LYLLQILVSALVADYWISCWSNLNKDGFENSENMFSLEVTSAAIFTSMCYISIYDSSLWKRFLLISFRFWNLFSRI